MKFCRYYLKLYQKLRDLDRNKVAGVKFSKAFSDFSVLVYHNIFGSNNPNLKQQAQTTKSTARRKNVTVSPSNGRTIPAKGNSQVNVIPLNYSRKVTFAGSNNDDCSSMGLL